MKRYSKKWFENLLLGLPIDCAGQFTPEAKVIAVGWIPHIVIQAIDMHMQIHKSLAGKRKCLKGERKSR